MEHQGALGTQEITRKHHGAQGSTRVHGEAPWSKGTSGSTRKPQGAGGTVGSTRKHQGAQESTREHGKAPGRKGEHPGAS